MSIALVAEVYDEARRLAIAGSTVAPGDFRIKKLIAPLEQVGAKAPVFARVAEAVKAVVESTDKTSAQTLLDLTTLVSAILYTQGETGTAGELQPIETTDLGLVATQTSARVLKPLLEALSTKGSGRLELSATPTRMAPSAICGSSSPRSPRSTTSIRKSPTSSATRSSRFMARPSCPRSARTST